MAVDGKQHWASILRDVAQSPLAFMGLCTLCLGVALPSSLGLTDLPPHQDLAVITGFGVMLFIGVLLVIVMAVRYPSNLKDLTEAAERVDELHAFIEGDAFRDVVLDICSEELEQSVQRAESEQEEQA